MTECFRSTQAIGKVTEIWRYPVSSLAGERCSHAEIGPSGIVGDRRFGLFDVASGIVAAPEKDLRWRPALFLKAAIDEGGARVGFPDGNWLYLEDPLLFPRLAEHFGFDVGVGSYAEADPLAPSVPRIHNRYLVSPLHLVTSASLQELQNITPESTVDRLRFRPNILLETEGLSGFPEFCWLGETIKFGTVRVKVTEMTKRCGMTFVAQPELAEQPEILRTMVRKTGRSFGVYCEPTHTGHIENGAYVEKWSARLSA